MARHLRLGVDLELEATPFSGTLSSDLLRVRPSQGWLELASPIEELATVALTNRESRAADLDAYPRRAAHQRAIATNREVQ
jgi:hypothetical protein